MNRILRGTVLLAVSALVWGCNTEPEETEGGDPAQIVANPGVVFVDQGASNEVFVRLVDQQGTSLSTDVSVTVADPSVIQVSADSMFRPVFGPDGVLGFNTNNSELRLVVTGLALNATSFTISAGGLTTEVPVSVLPTALAGTLSATSADVGEPVTLTAPAGFSFNETSEVTFEAGDAAATLSVAADGSTITFIPKPGSSGSVSTVSDVSPGYAPSLQLPLSFSSEPFALTAVSLYSSADPATAPAFPIPAVGDTTVIYDHSVAVDQLTLLEITEPGTVLDVTVDWTGGADMDFYFCAGAAACTFTGRSPAANGATAAHPEHVAVTFPAAGTYTLLVNLYSGDAPTYTTIQIARME